MLSYFINNKVFKNSSFVMSKKSEMIIIGHSQPANAFNDSIINKFSNFSEHGESYYFTYSKLFYLLKHNKNIKHVFLEFSNNVITKRQEEFVFRNFTLKFVPIYYPFLSNTQKVELLQNNFTSFTQSFSQTTINNLNRIRKNDYNYCSTIGSFQPSSKIKSNSFFANINNQEYIDTAFSTFALPYLNKIINLCKQHNANLYLTRSPLHKNYNKHNEKKLQSILSKEYADLPFLDFSNFSLNNENYIDFNHLNSYGATIFSNWFNQLIKDGLLTQQNKQVFINQKMKLLKPN
jgi:hypothetical protein